MKITITQKVLLNAIKKGCFAALCPQAQADTGALSQVIKSVKITAAKDEICFESSNSLVASKYAQPTTDDVVVHEEGEAMVLAKELYDWVNGQGDCTIGMKLNSIKDDDTKNKKSDEIFQNGSLGIFSKDKSKTGSKWSLNSYNSGKMFSMDSDFVFEPLFTSYLDQINDGLKYISFCALESDDEHVFDSISFQNKNQEIYMISTDCTRCATWKISGADNITLNQTVSHQDMMESGNENSWARNLMISSNFLNEFCKLASKESPIAFYRCDNSGRVFLSQPGFTFGMSTAAKNDFDKFPPLNIFLEKKYEELCSIPRDTLLTRLKTVSIVNKNAILFDFKNDQLILEGISEVGLAPCRANVSANKLAKNIKKVWNVNHFKDILKSLKSDNVILLLPKDMASVKIVSSDIKNLTYYSMSIEISNYNLED